MDKILYLTRSARFANLISDRLDCFCLLTYVTFTWNSTIQSYGWSSIVALDIATAFDGVRHTALWNKVQSFRLWLWTC